MAEQFPLSSPLFDIAKTRFLGHTYPQETVLVISSTSVSRVANNPNRVNWIMINEGSTDIRLSNLPNVSSTSGWLLSANGGIVEMDWAEDAEAVSYDVYLIAVSGTPNVRLREVIRS